MTDGHSSAPGFSTSLTDVTLHGPDGDAVNAILCAIGHNCRLLLAWFRRLLACLANTAPSIVAEILDAIAAIMQPRPTPQILAA